MSAARVEVLVEEPSMEAALRVLLPGILGRTSFRIHAHQGKGDLLRKLPERLRAYARWKPAGWRIVVIVDRDDEDCRSLKDRLERIAAAAGHVTRSRAAGGAHTVVNRIAIEELEAWYFGDWDAVRAAYPRVSAAIPGRAGYRRPDAIKSTWEAFESVLRRAGYFRGGLRKIEAARAIAAHMDPARNTSHSFQVFRAALREVAR